MNSLQHKHWMTLALCQALKGWNRTQPNPSVGAVIVKDDILISEGYTLPAGGDHAEIQAIKKCTAEELQGATLYVTLEPCSHYGKTPPCSKTIIDTGIERVVIASEDPNPLVNGRGIKMLRDSGVDVIEGVLKNESDQLYDGFFTFISKKRIKVTLKIAQSQNGCIAGPNREQVVITSLESRKRVHDLRAHADAILVGGSTARIDNPLLDTRLSDIPDKIDPDRVVIDYSGTVSSNLNLFREDGRRVFAAHNGSGSYPQRVTPIHLTSNVMSQNILQLFRALYEHGVHHLFVEPGGILAQEIISHGFFDELYLFTGSTDITNGYKWHKYEGLEWKESLEFCTFEHINTDLLEIFKNPQAFN